MVAGALDSGGAQVDEIQRQAGDVEQSSGQTGAAAIVQVGDVQGALFVHDRPALRLPDLDALKRRGFDSRQVTEQPCRPGQRIPAEWD